MGKNTTFFETKISTVQNTVCKYTCARLKTQSWGKSAKTIAQNETNLFRKEMYSKVRLNEGNSKLTLPL